MSISENPLLRTMQPSLSTINVSCLLDEIKLLETKKQEILKTLSTYSKSIDQNPIFDQVKPFDIKNLTQTPQSIEKKQLLIENIMPKKIHPSQIQKNDTNKPSHLYLALAKYLFYDPNSHESISKNEWEENNIAIESMITEQNGLKDSIMECFTKEKETKKNYQDNESLESVSTRDTCLFIKQEFENEDKKNSWNSKEESIFEKYVDELKNDLISLKTEKLSERKKTTIKNIKEKRVIKTIHKTENLSKRTRSRFTTSEDHKIINLIQVLGQNWKEIASNLPGRTEGMVKNRYYSHIKKNYFCAQIIQDSLSKELESEFSNIQNQKIIEEKPIQNNLDESFNADFLSYFNFINEKNEIDANHQFLDQVAKNDLECDLLRTPRTYYNFDEYNGGRTPIKEMEFILNDSFCLDDDNNEKKVQIKLLSDKIENIESLLKNTKNQITDMIV